MKKKRIDKKMSLKNQNIEKKKEINIFKNRTTKAILFFAFGLLLAFAIFGLAGRIGEFIHHKIIKDLFGYGFIILPIFFILSGIYTLMPKRSFNIKKKVSMIIIFFSFIGLAHIIFPNKEIIYGGFIGKIIGNTLVKGFDIYISIIFLLVLLIIFGIILFNPDISSIKNPLKTIKTIGAKKGKDNVGEITEEDEEFEGKEKVSKKKNNIKIFGDKKDSKEFNLKTDITFAEKYNAPPLSLLSLSSGKPSVGDTEVNANQIQRTLHNFGISVIMDEITIGPTVTRYTLKPAEGVKLSRIIGLQNDLALALAAHPLRIEAPIPGKSLVGIEIPNSTRSLIGLGSLLGDKEFIQSPKHLFTALGKDVTGKSYFSDISKMPHLLIAGATGSGKSVMVHNIITSLLYKNGPDMLRFIMIDPKRVELTLYNKIPHLLTPVITKPKQSILALKWAIKEMERRYDVLEAESVRDIFSYHKKIVQPAYESVKKKDIEKNDPTLPEKMPYILIIIDELADIMTSYPRELESAVVRLAQMSRAIGIHLILSTQRPSVNVITGLIKANIPARIALKVASQVDSRTILDTSGAEKLLGAGDMLFVGGNVTEPTRIQSPFLSEDEVKKVVSFLKKQYIDELPDEILFSDTSIEGVENNRNFSEEDRKDPLYKEAKKIVLESKKASTSYLQRRLRIGYSRAARLIDILESHGIVGPADGSKPREILSDGENIVDTEVKKEEISTELDEGKNLLK